MMSKPLSESFTRKEKSAIRRFLRRMETAADRAYDKATAAQRGHKSDYTDYQVVYWKNVRAAFRWAHSLLKNR